ncbi:MULTISPECIES: hypothetical protein [unclassified Leifsonia]|uniref:hypothetical protein n=1 Tax=unclassified Leifsonia TaxID=2663824 RepID=UPI0008A79110|nr:MULTISPECIES: hypothetical protein [unclassified Leifsonia]SEI02874.1 hypothetical protein SAMN04515694_110103 [Leifsonia sp. CL154]SFL71888.1 hypothetical protein SAMN04515692_110103 [Leifsonia sp. CL147]
MRLEKSRRHKLRVHWPVSAETFESLVASAGAAYLSEDLRPLRNVIETTSELGDFGAYTDVVEMSLGVETFLVGDSANATLGARGERCVSPTLVVTTYLSAGLSAARVDQVISEFVSAHPWEVPVIELSETVELVTSVGAERTEVLA